MRPILQLSAATILVLLAALTSTIIAADAQPTPKELKLGPLAGKLDDRLIPAVRVFDDGSASPESLSVGTRAAYSLRTSATQPAFLALEILVPEVNAQALDEIAATGAQITFSSAIWKTVCVRANLAQVAVLAQMKNVRKVKLPGRSSPRAQQGLAYNQSDATMHADVARNTTGLTGRGQKIGVLSDSYNDNPGVIGAGTQTPAPLGVFLTGTVPQLSGDVPQQIQVIDFGPGNGTDEGEGMMELIHDIAPNAAIAFASGNGSEVEYANNINSLRLAGCTIICDDLFYFEEPCFQDGPVAQAINTNFDAGVPHFTAAGNSASNGIFATYSPVNPANSSDNKLDPPDSQDFHNWGLGGATPGLLPITVPAGNDIDVVLQWNQPYESHGLGAGSSVDLDILLYDTDTDLSASHIVAAGGNAQFVNSLPSGDAVESFQYFNNTGSAKTFYLAVNHYSGSRANTVFRVMFYNRWNSLTYPPTVVKDMTMAGHSAAAKAISCGAIFFADIETNGQWGPDITHINAERFTSKGGIGSAGVPYYFDTQGNPLPGGPVRVDKPDITAPDGGNTSLFGGDINLTIGGVLFDADSFPNFFGTSAAAPNAAAVAALMLERASKSSPAQIKAALQATAHDIVSDIPKSGFGPDEFTGSGWIDAAAAVGLVPGVLDGPSDVTVNPGQTATFSIFATGGSSLVYQWQKNGISIPNANSSSLTIDPATLGDDGSVYVCLVGNGYGNAISSEAKLSVNPPPKITLDPKHLSVDQGATAQFTVAATNGTLSYQWRSNGSDIPGAIFTNYALVGAAPSDNGAQFTCLVTNAAGSTLSGAATLTVKPRPKITQQPQDQTVNQGAAAQISVVAENGLLTYQWRRNGVEIPGATAASYTLMGVVLSDDGSQFTCLVTNASGSTLSNPATLIVKPRPVILTQPASLTVASGRPAAFQVSAANGLLSYQWRRNGENISGAVTSAYIIPATALSDDGAQLTCLITNSAGSILSDVAVLTVSPRPKITLNPQNQTVNQGATAQFTVLAENGTLTYQWRRGNVDIPGAIFSSYALIGATPDDDGALFSCVITNASGSTLSETARLTVKPRPAIVTQPKNIVVAIGTPAAFAIVAANDTLSYQWRRNGADIFGATDSTFAVPTAALADSGALFQCLVTNAAGSTLSDLASLTVIAPPQIGSSLTASPQVSAPGQLVVYSVAATSTSDKSLSYTWNFGDGSQETKGPDASLSHAFATPGRYGVSVTVVDELGQSSSANLIQIVFSDPNSDGMPDIIPDGDNSGFADMVALVGEVDIEVPTISKLAIKLDFSKENNADELMFVGTLPLPSGQDLTGEKIQFVIGGYGRAFTLGASGASQSFPGGTGNFRFKASKTNTLSPVARYQLCVKKKALRSYFTDEGLTNGTVSDQEIRVRVSILFGGVLYDTYRTQSYSAKKDGIGIAK